MRIIIGLSAILILTCLCISQDYAPRGDALAKAMLNKMHSGWYTFEGNRFIPCDTSTCDTCTWIDLDVLLNPTHYMPKKKASKFPKNYMSDRGVLCIEGDTSVACEMHEDYMLRFQAAYAKAWRDSLGSKNPGVYILQGCVFVKIDTATFKTTNPYEQYYNIVKLGSKR